MKRTVKTLSVVALSMMLAAPAFAANTPEGNIELEWGYRPKQGASQQLIAIANHPMPKEAMGKGFPALVEALTGKPIEQVVPESHYVQVGAVEENLTSATSTGTTTPPAPVPGSISVSASGQTIVLNPDGSASATAQIGFGEATIPAGATVNSISGQLTSQIAGGGTIDSIGDTITGNIPGLGSVTLTLRDGYYQTEEGFTIQVASETSLNNQTTLPVDFMASGYGTATFTFTGTINYTK